MDFTGLDSLIEDKVKDPSNLDMIYYIFFDKGVTLVELNELPIPYILNILQTYSYLKGKELDAHKKASRK